LAVHRFENADACHRFSQCCGGEGMAGSLPQAAAAADSSVSAVPAMIGKSTESWL
jgi:hypothetical protein